MKFRTLPIVLLVFLAMAGITACGDDDDDNDAVDDDDDDDNDDDDNDDDDDDNDDDDDDNDNDDDDDDNDDTVPPLDPPTYGWILMDTDREHLSDMLELTAEFGIDHVQLSHSLIMNIDEINEDDARAQLLQDVAQEAHALGLEVYVWAHEFYGESFVLCFDPEDSLWGRRRDAYRDALERIPEIDGVMLMFGSAETEPWYSLCMCDWCEENEPTGNQLLSWMYPRPAERLRMIYDAVGGVVMDEFGKKLRVRTFMHQPLEIAWLRDSLDESTDPGLMVMSKDVPQDWQPYYPHNPLIGDIGPRHQIVEMDLGNEYWGKSKILNAQVDYLFYRYTHDRAMGTLGAAARIERGADHALGTPNEINLYAFSRLVPDETVTPDQVYREWFDQRYGIGEAEPAADTLKTIFRQSHYAMRKMYYTLGQWTMIKGSDVPDQARYPEQLWARCSGFYDPTWLGLFGSLVIPDEQTLRDLWQEGAESRELAADNRALLETIEGSFDDPADYAQLHEMLAFHIDLAEVWQLMIDTTYRYVYSVLGHPEQNDYLEFNARRLLELADEIEANWGAGADLMSPSRVRDFVADLRQGVPLQPEALEYAPPALSDIAAEPLGAGVYHVTWASSEATSSWVEWSADLPLYDNVTPENNGYSLAHEVDVLIDDGRHVFRVAGHTEEGTLVRSGDFWVGLDP